MASVELRRRIVPRTDPQGHLNLLHDCLSPAASILPASTPAQIALQLGSLDAKPFSHLLRTLALSASLWPPSGREIPLQRAIDVFTAIVRGFLLRIDGIAADDEANVDGRTGFGLGPGWRGRRELAAMVEAVVAAAEQPTVRSDVRLLIFSALLASLQAVKQRRDELYVGGRQLIPRAETAVLAAWQALLAPGALESGASAAPGVTELTDRSADVPCWLAAHSMPDIESSRLAVLPHDRFFDVLTATIARTLGEGRIFDGLDDDLSTTDAGLHWHDPSPSRRRLTEAHASPLFGVLGPLSQTLGKAIESDTSIITLRAALLRLRRLERIAQLTHQSWASTRWAELPTDATGAITPEEGATLPWSTLKTLLFALTMVHASVVSLLTAAPSTRADDAPPPISIDLATCTLRTFSHLYFVTSRFGTDGFGAYRGVWLGTLDLLGRAPAEELVRAVVAIEPDVRGPDHALARTYYLNALEQVVNGMPDDYIEDVALPIAQPCVHAAENSADPRSVLEDGSDRDAFEAAHSVMLAIYVAGKRVADQIAPWYTDLLLRSYPDLMSAAQLRIAYTAVIRRASQTNDALAWLLLTRLVAAIEAIPAATVDRLPTTRHAHPQPLTTRRPKDDNEPTVEPQDDDLRDPSTGSSDTESAALHSTRGHLLLVLVDQLAAVNLTLLLPLLEQVRRLLAAEPVEGARAVEARRAIIKVAFERLAGALDAPKRETGTRWWAEHGRELET